MNSTKILGGLAALLLGLGIAAPAPVFAQDDDDRPRKKKQRDEEEGEGERRNDEGERDREREREEAERARERRRAKAEADAKAETAKPTGEKDHDHWVGHVGASWFGVSTVPIATGGPSGTKDNPGVAPGAAPATVSVPAVGIRYWLSSQIGIDAGIGFSASTGSIRATTFATDKQSVFAMLIHAGMPVSPVAGKHIALTITPEINFGFATSSVEPSGPQPNPPPSASLFGQRFDIGARIGGEIYFGFIGIPELALEGSFGAYFTHQRTSISVDTATYTDTSVLATTANFKDPWQLFASSIAARYYF
jgi:hypothetical protein